MGLETHPSLHPGSLSLPPSSPPPSSGVRSWAWRKRRPAPPRGLVLPPVLPPSAPASLACIQVLFLCWAHPPGLWTASSWGPPNSLTLTSPLTQWGAGPGSKRGEDRDLPDRSRSQRWPMKLSSVGRRAAGTEPRTGPASPTAATQGASPRHGGQMGAAAGRGAPAPLPL